jgi:carbamoyl-phosphate synthase large subunit
MKRDLNHPLSIRSKVKNKTTRHDLGEWLCVSSGISQGVFVDDSNIRQQSIDIAQSLNSMGPLNIQARLVNGRLITFEINPRFSGTSYFRALAGVNEVNLFINYKQHYDGSVLVPRGGKCRRIITEMYSPE